jgi:predicted tellurium resistance membrane protein TerC
MFESITNPQACIATGTQRALEIVVGIDNIFVSPASLIIAIGRAEQLPVMIDGDA